MLLSALSSGFVALGLWAHDSEALLSITCPLLTCDLSSTLTTKVSVTPVGPCGTVMPDHVTVVTLPDVLWPAEHGVSQPAETKAVPDGTTSVTVTPLASASPLLVTCSE